MSKEEEIASKITRAFLSQVYDEWITGVDSSESPTVNAQTCRALGAALGQDAFKTIVNALVAENVIEISCDFEKAEPSEIAITILDYSVK